MLLAREFIDYLSRQLVQKLSAVMETGNPGGTAEVLANTIAEDLSVEDRLNEEVRSELDQYSDYMRQNGISYQEMFRKVKNQYIQKRKIIRASGRDTGDNMKLSRDKINDLSHKLVAALRKQRDVRIKRDPNQTRLEMVKVITDILVVDEKADKAARDKVKTIKREIIEGGDEWDVLHKRYYAEELKRLGIDLNAR